MTQIPRSAALPVLALLCHALFAGWVVDRTANAQASQQASKGRPLKRSDFKQKWRFDRYTKNDPEALARAGYVAYYPFPFGEHGGKPTTTKDIELNVAGVKLLWVETAHFRIGSALRPFPIPASDRTLRKKLEVELTKLKKKIPSVNPKTRKLDRWLRLHLFAQRCEETYEDFSKRLQVTEASFPKTRATLMKGKYMGEGPYLGQQGKYLVIMFDKSSDYVRFLATFIGRTEPIAQRWNFKTVGSQIFATAADLDNGELRKDTRMHCHIVWNVVHNLINGYRFYAYDLPVWFNEGMAHWYSRRVSEKYALDFDQNESAHAKLINDSKWRPRARRWLAGKKFRSVSGLLTLRDFGQLTKYDHIQAWSLCDMLMSEGDEKWRVYMNVIKGYIDPKSHRAAAREVLNLQRKGLKKAYGLSPLKLGEKWKVYVRKEYPLR